MVIIKNNRPRLHFLGSHQLMPGTNEVPDEVWASFEKNDMVKIHIDLGDLEVVKSGVPDEASPLKGLKPSGAVKLVSETFDLGLLDKWKGLENRGAVIKAIDTQVALIHAQGVKKPDEAEAGAPEAKE